jgi:hypothetical protein
MAFTQNDRFPAIANEWNQQIVSIDPSWSKFCNVRSDNVMALQNYADITPGTLAAYSGTTISEESKSYGAFATQTVTADGFARKVTLARQQVNLDPGLVEREASKLFDAAVGTVEKSVYAALEAGMTHMVDAGKGDGTNTYVLDGTFYLSDGSTQSNSMVDPLSATSLASARQKMVQWKSYNGDPMGLGLGPLALIVSPKNEDLALQIVGSPTKLETFAHDVIGAAAGANINPQAGRAIDVIVSPYLTADDDDWFLVQTGAQSPVFYWTQAAPHMEIVTKAETQQIVLSVTMYHKVFIQTPPNGIIGSNVPA